MTATPTSDRPSFQDFLDQIHALPESDRWGAADRFMGSLASVPYAENDTLAHFLFRGDAENVTIPGDTNSWNPSGSPMKRIPGTDLWHYTLSCEPNARLDYKFLINGSAWILDPLNPRRIAGSYGENSELRMPHYVSPPEIEDHPEIPHGRLTETTLQSSALGHARSMRIYTPYNYDITTERLPVVCFHDGYDFLSLGSAQNILDFLIARKRMVPVIAVFIPPVNRDLEYAGAHMGSYYAFIVDELLPSIDRTYRTTGRSAERASIGVSNGGNISLWLGLNYPETFRNIAALSSNVTSVVSSGYENSPRLSLRFYIDVGTYDIPQLIPLAKTFTDLLRSKGYPVFFRRHHEGHSWGNWRAHVGRALRYFFPPKKNTMCTRPTRRFFLAEKANVHGG